MIDSPKLRVRSRIRSTVCSVVFSSDPLEPVGLAHSCSKHQLLLARVKHAQDSAPDRQCSRLGTLDGNNTERKKKERLSSNAGNKSTAKVFISLNRQHAGNESTANVFIWLNQKTTGNESTANIFIWLNHKTTEMNRLQMYSYC